MTSIRQGAFRIFRFAGIDVFLHWSWFLLAAYEINARTRAYSSLTWNVLEYLSLFFIVMLHEFGHALACRQVGGTANQIVLWPLGGVAYVDPPPRPGATLWSIAAGPLVNVVLVPLLTLVLFTSRWFGWGAAAPNIHELIRAVWGINLGLLIFNILPIYPLDGGQILRSLLWFVVGRARSLMVATGIGIIGAVGFTIVALWIHSVWWGVLAVFILMNSWSGFQHARALSALAKLPRRHGFACPSCKTPPAIGNMWKCGRCQQMFDTFETGAVCPHCGTQFAAEGCMECGQQHPINEWMVAATF